MNHIQMILDSEEVQFYTTDPVTDSEDMLRIFSSLSIMIGSTQVTSSSYEMNGVAYTKSYTVYHRDVKTTRIPPALLYILADSAYHCSILDLKRLEQDMKRLIVARIVACFPDFERGESIVDILFEIYQKSPAGTNLYLTEDLLSQAIKKFNSTCLNTVGHTQAVTTQAIDECEGCHTKDEIKEYDIKRCGVKTKAKLCGKCYISTVFHCPVCGEECQSQDAEVLDGTFVCRECLEKLRKKHSQSIYFCIGCREYHTRQKYGKNRANENKWVCDMHLSSAGKCDSCGMLLINNRFEATSIMRSFSGGSYCGKCYARDNKYFIKRYHDDPPMQFYEAGEDGKNTYSGVEKADNVYYGLELEVDAGGQRDDISKPTLQLLNDEAYAMRDGSLQHGFEIITFPHTEEALYNMNWRETFKFLVKNGYRSHDINTCGLHLHVNRRCFGPDSTARQMNIAKLMYFFERNRDEFIKLSRREEAHINRWAKFYADKGSNVDLAHYLLVYNHYNNSRNHDDRYKAINLCKRATIEFRLMRGTLKLDTFLATLDVLITISKNSKTTSGTSPREWLRGIKPATIQYLKENKIFEGEI